MVPNRSTRTSRLPPGPWASEARTPSSPTVAAASRTATPARASLLVVPPLAAVRYMDPPFRRPLGGDLLPGGARRGTALDRVEHLLHVQAVGERRRRVAAGGDRLQQVAYLVGEGVLVADAVALGPPGGGIGVDRPGHLDPPEPLGGRVVGGVEEPQLVERPQFPDEAAELAVELDPEALVMPGGEAGGLEAADRPAGEAGDEQGRVVDRDRPQLATAAPGKGPLGHEGLGEGRDAGDPVPGHVLGQVDGVGAEIAEGPRPRLGGLEPPDQRELGVEEVGAQVGGPDVADGA